MPELLTQRPAELPVGSREEIIKAGTPAGPKPRLHPPFLLPKDTEKAKETSRSEGGGVRSKEKDDDDMMEMLLTKSRKNSLVGVRSLSQEEPVSGSRGPQVLRAETGPEAARPGGRQVAEQLHRPNMPAPSTSGEKTSKTAAENKHKTLSEKQVEKAVDPFSVALGLTDKVKVVKKKVKSKKDKKPKEKKRTYKDTEREARKVESTEEDDSDSPSAKARRNSEESKRSSPTRILENVSSSKASEKKAESGKIAGDSLKVVREVERELEPKAPEPDLGRDLDVATSQREAAATAEESNEKEDLPTKMVCRICEGAFTVEELVEHAMVCARSDEILAGQDEEAAAASSHGEKAEATVQSDDEPADEFAREFGGRGQVMSLNRALGGESSGGEDGAEEPIAIGKGEERRWKGWKVLK
jgi:hypothetical protein